VAAGIVHEVSRSLALPHQTPPEPPAAMALPEPKPAAVAAEAPMFASVGRRRFSFF
jgi:hypothetical protein